MMAHSSSHDRKPAGNRRTGSERRVIHVVARFEALTMLQPTQGEGYTYDLTIKGCRIESDVRIEPGSYLSLCFHIEHHTPIRVSVARVRWVRGPAFGVEFLKIAEPDNARLEQFLWNPPAGPSGVST